MRSALTDGLHVPRDSRVHRLSAHVKIVTAVLTVLAVVATPRTQLWAYPLHAVVVVAVVAAARLPPALVLRRMVVETPFVVFALLLPFVAQGATVSVHVLGRELALSRTGLVGAASLLATSTLGVVVAIVLAATTTPRDLLDGLQRLRVPTIFVTILHFMVRYLGVVADDMQRMRIARESRGFRPRHLGHARVLARAAGALFVRSYERGERVHRAMLSRGWSGGMPLVRRTADARPDWAAATVVPAAAVLVAVAATVAPWRAGG